MNGHVQNCVRGINFNIVLNILEFRFLRELRNKQCFS